MAALNRPGTDRGQLILVTGLTIAVILVALVVLLNTVIYTENLATRGVDAGGGDAIEYRATVVGSVSELIAEENAHYDEEEPPVDGIETGIETIDETLSERHLTRGAVAETRVKDGGNSVTNGSAIIWQTDDRGFINNEETDNWTVATDVTDTERFVLTVDSVNPAAGNEEPFRLVMDDWSMEIEVAGENETDGVNVTIKNASTTAIYEYGTDEMPLEVDLVDGTIESSDPTELRTIDPVPPSSVSQIGYENGDRATGTFELRSDGTPDGTNLTEYDGRDGSDPYYTHTVERVDLVIHYETTELRYTTEATVEAGESA